MLPKCIFLRLCIYFISFHQWILSKSPRLREWYNFLWKERAPVPKKVDSLCNSKCVFPKNMKDIEVRTNTRMPYTAQPSATSYKVFSLTPNHSKSPILTQVTRLQDFTHMNRSLGFLLCFHFPHSALSHQKKCAQDLEQNMLSCRKFVLYLCIDIFWNFLLSP